MTSQPPKGIMRCVYERICQTTKLAPHSEVNGTCDNAMMPEAPAHEACVRRIKHHSHAKQHATKKCPERHTLARRRLHEHLDLLRALPVLPSPARRHLAIHVPAVALRRAMAALVLRRVVRAPAGARRALRVLRRPAERLAARPTAAVLLRGAVAAGVG